MLIFMPQEFYAPVGIAMTPMLATNSQAHGATLIGLGVIDWLARGADRRGIVAVFRKSGDPDTLIAGRRSDHAAWRRDRNGPCHRHSRGAWNLIHLFPNQSHAS